MFWTICKRGSLRTIIILLWNSLFSANEVYISYPFVLSLDAEICAFSNVYLKLLGRETEICLHRSWWNRCKQRQIIGRNTKKDRTDKEKGKRRVLWYFEEAVSYRFLHLIYGLKLKKTHYSMISMGNFCGFKDILHMFL